MKPAVISGPLFAPVIYFFNFLLYPLKPQVTRGIAISQHLTYASFCSPIKPSISFIKHGYHPYHLLKYSQKKIVGELYTNDICVHNTKAFSKSFVYWANINKEWE